MQETHYTRLALRMKRLTCPSSEQWWVSSNLPFLHSQLLTVPSYTTIVKHMLDPETANTRVIKQSSSCVNNKVARQRQSKHTQGSSYFSLTQNRYFSKEKKSKKEEELPWVGFEPTTLCSLGERSSNSATRETQLVGVRIYNTAQHKAST